MGSYRLKESLQHWLIFGNKMILAGRSLGEEIRDVFLCLCSSSVAKTGLTTVQPRPGLCSAHGGDLCMYTHTLCAILKLPWRPPRCS